MSRAVRRFGRYVTESEMVKDQTQDEPCLLQVDNLRTHFHTREGTLRALDGVSFRIAPREVLGVVGESGCGKTLTAYSIMRILPSAARIVRGKIVLHGRAGRPVNLARLDPKGKEIRAIRGREIAMIFQEPMASFSPVHTIGNQITEHLRLHQKSSRDQAREQVLDMLRRVGMPKPSQAIDAYPFRLSGGMRQRAMIAMALVCHPRLLIADEPTTALDVTMEAQILELMRELHGTLGMSVMIITHDLSVVAEVSRNVLVMYLGQDVEYAPVQQLFSDPKHPYTSELLASVPKLGRKSGERLHTIRGSVPSLYERPRGCPFHPRCRRMITGVCDTEAPPVTALDDGHHVRCFLYGDSAQGSAEETQSRQT